MPFAHTVWLRDSVCVRIHLAVAVQRAVQRQGPLGMVRTLTGLGAQLEGVPVADEDRKGDE